MRTLLWRVKNEDKIRRGKIQLYKKKLQVLLSKKNGDENTIRFLNNKIDRIESHLL